MSTEMETTLPNPEGAPLLPPPMVTAVPAPAERVEALPSRGLLARLFGNTWAIAKKELNIYFTTPLAYVLLAFFIFVMGYFFLMRVNIFLDAMSRAQQFQQFQPGVMDQLNFTDIIFAPLINTAGLFFAFILPFLSMRLVAEEKRQHTFQLLMTAPVSSWEIVLGKYLAACVVILLATALTGAYPLLLNMVSDGGVEPQTALVAYLGLFLVGATFMAIGLFISSLTDSQIVAGVVTLLVCVLFWVLAAAGQFGGNGEASIGKDLAEWGCAQTHLVSFMKGVLNLGDCLYYVSIVVLGLFLTRTAIERARW